MQTRGKSITYKQATMCTETLSCMDKHAETFFCGEFKKWRNAWLRPMRGGRRDRYLNSFSFYGLFSAHVKSMLVPPESTRAFEPERRCTPLGQRKHKETGREGMRFLATQSPISPGRASLPWSVPPSCLVIIPFYSFLKQSLVLSHFSFHNPVCVCSASSDQARYLPSLSSRRKGLLDPGWFCSFEML